MVLNVKKNYAFVHVPKTGGSTIEYLFFNRYLSSCHSSIDEYHEHYQKYIFTFVRNPYLRCLSSFFYYKNGGNKTKLDAKKKQLCKNLDHFFDLPTSQISALRTQFSFLKDHPSIDYVGRFENFEKDVKFLCKKLSVKYQNKHLRKNSSYDSHVITPRIVQKISERYAIDFEKYNYKKIEIQKALPFREFCALVKKTMTTSA